MRFWNKYIAIINFCKYRKKKELKTALNNIIEDLGFILKQTLMSKSDKTETKQKITLIKKFNERLNTIKKADIEKQLQSHEWLT